MADNRPTHRIIAKLTDSRSDYYQNVGVAWAKKNDDGDTIVSLKFNGFTDGAKLMAAQSLLLVRNEPRDGRPRAPRSNAGDGSGQTHDPGPSDDPGPVDDDIPF